MKTRCKVCNKPIDNRAISRHEKAHAHDKPKVTATKKGVAVIPDEGTVFVQTRIKEKTILVPFSASEVRLLILEKIKK